MAEVKKKVILEVFGGQYDVAKISDNALKACKKADKNAKDICIYVKPEDGKAYYSANDGKLTGNIDI